jgi:haloalkane dehalogenase
VLQYPSKRELIAELQKGYDYVAVSFLLAVFHRMQEVVALVRQHAPQAKIVLGGYGTVLADDVLAPYADHICREEGVAFLRALLGEPPIPMPYTHPLIVSHLRVFGARVSKTGMIFAGLGCPNGCDFCCTSHFFGRKHIRLLPTGKDIHAVVRRYLELDPAMSLVVLDEDFLLNHKRAREFAAEVRADGRPLSIFCFASIRALSHYKVEELVAMGIDGLWIGYEGRRSGFQKQQGRPVEELFAELRAHGISILASMIVGLPYQDDAIVQQELDGLLALRPSLCQFLIYGPTPGTPFFERVTREGTLRRDLVDDPQLYYKKCDGFTAMVNHPLLSPAQIEAQQRDCFRQDFERLGPSIYRSIEAWLRGHLRLKQSSDPLLQAKAAAFAVDVRHAYPVFLAGRLFGPNRAVRRQITLLQREVHTALGAPTVAERLRAVVAAVLAVWTALTLRLDLFQHPRLVRHTYRLPAAEPKLARAWRQLRGLRQGLSLDRSPEGAVLVALRGELRAPAAERLSLRLSKALRRSRDHLVLDCKRLTQIEAAAAHHLADTLHAYRDRIRIHVPQALLHPAVAAAFAMFVLQPGLDA